MSETPQRPMFIRPCFQQDLELVQLIYAHHVITGTGTFELEPPTLADMEARWSKIVSHGWPYLVCCPADDMSRVLGFAYAGQFRDRPAYSKTFEDSIYVAPTSQRLGVGALLLNELINTLRADGVREVLAVIGDSANQGSVGLHAKAGFRTVGTFTNVGFKFNRWLDVVLMQRSLRLPDQAQSNT